MLLPEASDGTWISKIPAICHSPSHLLHFLIPFLLLHFLLSFFAVLRRLLIQGFSNSGLWHAESQQGGSRRQNELKGQATAKTRRCALPFLVFQIAKVNKPHRVREELWSLALSKCCERKRALGIIASVPLSDTNGEAAELRYVSKWEGKCPKYQCVCIPTLWWQVCVKTCTITASCDAPRAWRNCWELAKTDGPDKEGSYQQNV